IAIGLPFLFSGREKMKWWGESIIGFALLFLGLAALKDTVPDLRENEQIFAFLQQFQDPGILSRLMFVAIGTILTIIMQSSSAAMTLTIALTAKGLPLDIAAAMVLGENIGTTITAELASLVANVHAKRSARIHSLFNIIGVSWMVLVAPFFLTFMAHILPPPTDGDTNQFALAAFHTSFNVINVLLLLGFVNKLVELARKSVKSKGDEDEEYRLEYINKGVFMTTEISIEEARKEVIQFGEITKKMSDMLLKLSDEEKEKKRIKLRKKIKKLEDFTDDLEEQIAEFLAKTTESPLSESSSREVQGLLSIINDLERVADIIYRMSSDTKRLDENSIKFTDEQRTNLNKLSVLVNEALDIMMQNLRRGQSKIDIKPAQRKEEEINKMVKMFKKEQLIAIENGNYEIKGGIIYRDIFNSYEKVGDHVINVSEALVGNIYAEGNVKKS
ncbi:MAG: Na/Pi symporter, partial [Cyclobacteriaceae bacterium]|nr:Na/Pi symporter [Cyclobacteriaceae bacterium]